MRRFLSILCLLVPALFGSGASAAAQGKKALSHASLTIDSTDVLPACLSADRLAAGVQKRLGREVFKAEPGNGKRGATLLIVVRLAIVRFQVWDVELTTLQNSEETSVPVTGRRSLRLKAPTCEDLLAPLTLIVTLTIDPTAIAMPPPSPAAAPAIVAQPAVVSRYLPWKFSMSAGLGVGFGALPGNAFLGQLGVLTTRENWPAFALRFGYQNATVTFAAADSFRKGNASFSLWNAGFDLMPRLWTHLYGVASLRCQFIAAEGSGFDQNKTSLTYNCSNGVGLLALVPVSSRFSLFLQAEVAVPWQKTRYVFTDNAGKSVDGFRSAPLHAGLALGLNFAF